MRPLRAYIYLNNLVNNYIYLKKLHGGVALAVLKADAYGHGAIPCAKALREYTDGFAVAFLEEAIELRDNGITEPIVLLEGVFSQQEYQLVDIYRLIPVIQNEQQLTWLFDYSWKNKVDIWIKLDTGMRRAGLMYSEFSRVFQQIRKHPKVASVVDMTHFAFADVLDSNFTQQQLDNFVEVTHSSGNLKSICNSATILYHTEIPKNIARIGISLYGIDPIFSNARHEHLKPVMHLYSEVFSVKLLKKNECIGYGGIFTAPYDMRIGLVACGYADGYPRLPSHDNLVWVDGIKSRVVGRISMDMLSVELTSEHQGVGSQVELWGERVSVSEVALRANTIPHELLCHLKRAHKIYIQ